MKRCPQCGREYDLTMSFCLDDGSELLYGPGTGSGSVDEPATAILHETAAPGEAPTIAQIHTTEQTAVLPSDVTGVPKTKGFDKRLILAPLSLAVFVLGGFFGYRYITPAQQIESIAVMPFVNESGNSDVDYLSDGITETLISSLSNIPNLSVKARSTVFYYKGKEASVKTIGKELNVQAVLLGRVSQRGDDLKLNLELVNTETQDVIWSEQYNRKRSDLVSIQSEIAKAVSDKLRSKLTKTEQERVSKTYTSSSEAQQLYLKGRFHWNKRTTADLQQAKEYFQQAIAEDPNYARALTGLADTLALMPYYGSFRPAEYMPLAKQAAQRALEIDPDLAEAHATLGLILANYDYDLAGAESELNRAIELDPKYPSAYLWLSEVYMYPGNTDQALSVIEKGLVIDPLSMILNNQKGRILAAGGDQDEAIAWFMKTVGLFPEALNPRLNLFVIYFDKGMYSEAMQERFTALRLAGADTIRINDLQAAFERGGIKGFAQRQLKDQLDRQRTLLEKDKNAYFRSIDLASSYALLQDKDKALEYLYKAYDQREPQIIEVKHNPIFGLLRDEPRFVELMRKIGLQN